MRAIQYQTTIHDVREVILAGSADLAFWRQRLQGEGLTPFGLAGEAQITISATSSKFRGLRFEEMTIAIAVCEQEGKQTPDGFFLAHAFNSRRLFALAERLFFRTPYLPGAISVQEKLPALARLTLGGDTVFEAAMSGDREPLQGGDERWEGAIYLPRRLSGRQTEGERFFACLGGPTQVYPFQVASDRCVISDHTHIDLSWLTESGFTANAWRLRSHATHARSRTYAR